MAKKFTWWRAAEIIGIGDRQQRRGRERYEKHGYNGWNDRRRGRPSERRIPVAVMEQVLGLYRDKYFDLNVWHFHENLRVEPDADLSPPFPRLDNMRLSAAHGSVQIPYNKRETGDLQTVLTRQCRALPPFGESQRESSKIDIAHPPLGEHLKPRLLSNQASVTQWQ